jgi:hypothetical protein
MNHALKFQAYAQKMEVVLLIWWGGLTHTIAVNRLLMDLVMLVF